MRVTAITTKDLEENLIYTEGNRETSDYLVGWMDLYGKGKGLGRGLIHRADQVGPGEDKVGEQMLDPKRQDVPSTLFGVIPKGWIWPGMWCVNKCRMVMGLLAGLVVKLESDSSKVSRIVISWYSGKYQCNGSSSPSRPCSNNCMIPTTVTALVIEAIRKISSLR